MTWLKDMMLAACVGAVLGTLLFDIQVLGAAFIGKIRSWMEEKQQ